MLSCSAWRGVKPKQVFVLVVQLTLDPIVQIAVLVACEVHPETAPWVTEEYCHGSVGDLPLASPVSTSGSAVFAVSVVLKAEAAIGLVFVVAASGYCAFVVESAAACSLALFGRTSGSPAAQ